MLTNIDEDAVFIFSLHFLFIFVNRTEHSNKNNKKELNLAFQNKTYKIAK